MEAKTVVVLILVFLVSWTASDIEEPFYPNVLICILVRNKAHTLPYFLGHLEELDYPKNRLHLFIRTDHNADSSVDVLETWIKNVSNFYGSIDFRADGNENGYDGENGPFHWTPGRYQRIIDLKEQALAMGRTDRYDYALFLDADCFLVYPRTLQRLMERRKAVIAPMLRSTGTYCNFWAGMDWKGYYLRTDNYEPINKREIEGCIPVPMIYSTVLIDLNDPKTTALTFDKEKLIGDDGKDRMEVDDILVFARSARNAGLELFLLNTFDFGYLLQPSEAQDTLEVDVENMRHLILETLFNGPPGLLYSPILNPTQHLTPKLPMEPGGYFDQVYLINLKRRADRRIRMEWCLRVLGINATLVEAVDGKKLNDSYVYDQLGIHMMPEYRDPYHKRRMTSGEIGCFLSHYHIWEDIRRHKHRRVLVFEDDLRFVKYFRNILAALLEESEERAVSWDLIYLGRKRLNPDNDGPFVSDCRYLSHVGYSYWTLSYALSYEGAMKLLDARPFDNLVPVDEYLPIMFDRHPESVWKSYFPKRDLSAFTAEPLLVYPTHYTGEPGYISDTENTPIVNTTMVDWMGPGQHYRKPEHARMGDEL